MANILHFSGFRLKFSVLPYKRGIKGKEKKEEKKNK